MGRRLEIGRINESERPNASGHIKSLGGNSGRFAWKHTEAQAIRWLEAGTIAYYVVQGGHEVEVIVARSAGGRKYLKLVADEACPENPPGLPACP